MASKGSSAFPLHCFSELGLDGKLPTSSVSFGKLFLGAAKIPPQHEARTETATVPAMV